MSIQPLLIWIPLLPLIASAIIGLGGKKLPRSAAHLWTIAAVGTAFVLSAKVLMATIDAIPTMETFILG